MICTVALASFALLHDKGIMEIPGLQIQRLEQTEFNEQTGEYGFVHRLVGTGLFNDPNDLSLILVAGLIIGLYLLGDRRMGILRLAWIGPILLLGYAFALTQSRGGFLALVAGLVAFAQARFGWKRMIIPAGIALPLLFVLFAGRQTSLSASEGTGQERLSLWSDALLYFRSAPVFGIGVGEFQEQAELVAHNSYLQCFAETGLVGGALFLGAFTYSLTTLFRLEKYRDRGMDPVAARLHP